MDGVFAEVHRVKYQPMIVALKTDGFVVTAQGEQKAGRMEVYQDGLLGHLVALLRAQLSVPHDDT
eukprot:803527-Prorocentrum_lima.AAC.1